MPRQEKQKKELVEKIAAEGARLKGEAGALAPAFVRDYFRNMAYEDMLEMTPADLTGSVLSIFRFLQKRKAGQTKIRVYNPNHEENGWQSTHTIIEIVSRDMPFLVDSTVAAVNRLELTVHLLIYPVIHVSRTARGRLASVGEDQPNAESVIQVQVSQQSGGGTMARIEEELRAVLQDVRFAVEDWQPMLGKIGEVLEELEAAPSSLGNDEIEEGKAFLKWISDDHFTFLGIRDYALKTRSGKTYLNVVKDSGLGLLRMVTDDSAKRHSAPLSKSLLRFAQRPELLIITKASAHSTVHRPGYLDYIGIRRFDSAGKVIGERRVLGLFTSAAYNRRPSEIPILRLKVSRVMERSRFRSDRHNAKSLLNILETYPREELFQMGEDELYMTVMGIKHLEGRQRIRLFVRRDSYARFLSCLVYVPRDGYNTAIRRRFQDILTKAFQGHAVEFTTHISDSPLARVHFIVRTRAEPPPFDVDAISEQLVEAARSWSDDLHDALIERWGEATGNSLYNRYREAFPPGYSDAFSARSGSGDLARIEKVLETDDIGMALSRLFEDDQDRLHFKLFRCDQPIVLSEALPMLEHMGLNVLAESAFCVRPKESRPVWVHDFELRFGSGEEIELRKFRGPFEEAFWQLWHGNLEDDGFNALVLGAGLTWREVTIVQAYHKYLRQVGIPFSQGYVEATVNQNPEVIRLLIQLFAALFDPESADIDRADSLRRDIEAAFDRVANLDQDRILRQFLNLLECTLRTNYYQVDSLGSAKPSLSLKLDSGRIDNLPEPRPMVEIFVYSPRVEAVHLRGGKVARGGLRWSDRPEDFRTEVLGLMKAQMVKNAVIVPVGSKGGFVVKKPPTPIGEPATDRKNLLDEVIECYKTMQRGLLDITDNLKGSGVTSPDRVVRRDGDDPYLVVAADKGTATFSDIANGVSESYGHWLGDAYASGGSAGYDHKKMGITARGAWESVKRHFREMGVDIQSEDVTVVGVGDMGGDVFGNGMLLSKHLRLVAAFNHLHIFIDPNPNAAKSWRERKRLFENVQGWDHYRKELISKGGGVFDRSVKSIRLSPQIQSLFGIEETSTTPAELIRAILRSKVDLLWFGGIGTYVKASGETTAEVGDRANDALRVDASEVRAKVVGEGANLGLTQLSRIEYAARGGRLNTDAIDNSAGVDCSDHEVNIKILLGGIVDNQDMTRKQRDVLLQKMTEEVGELVLVDNYQQSLAISIAESQEGKALDRQAEFMRDLERRGRLDRAIEFLPDDEEIAERTAAGRGLTRPELAVLLSYSKMVLYDELLASDLPDESLLVKDLLLYFPNPLREKYRREIEAHPLRREITATFVTNSMVNRVGPTFVHELRSELGREAPDIARAFAVTRDAFQLSSLWQEIESLDNRVPTAVQTTMHLEVMKLIERSTRWFLRHGGQPLDTQKLVQEYGPALSELSDTLGRLTARSERDQARTLSKGWIRAGVPEELARRIAGLSMLSSGCDIVRDARLLKRPVSDVGAIYFKIGAQFHLDWLRTTATALAGLDHWQKSALRAIVEELFDHQSDLTLRVFQTATNGASPYQLLEGWTEEHQPALNRTEDLFQELQSAGQPDLAMLTVASSQFRLLTGE